MGIPLLAANIASISLSGLLYGLFFVLFGGSTYLMINRRRVLGGPVRFTSFFDLQFIIGICICITVTAHWIVLVFRSFEAFIYDNEPDSFFGDLARPSYVAATALRFGAQRCADLLRIYRLCVVWSDLKAIAVVVGCMFLGTLGCDITILYLLTRWHAEQDMMHTTLGHVMISETVLMISMNLTCCIFIISRLWRTGHEASSALVSRNGIPTRKDNMLLWVMSIFAENATLYMMSIIAYFVSFLAGSALQYPLADFLGPVSGIAFMLINIRVALAYLEPSRATSDASAIEFASGPPRRKDESSGSDMSFTLAPINLNALEDAEELDSKVRGERERGREVC